MAKSKLVVGVVGCGDISKIYLQNMPTFESLEVKACADLVPERAQARSKEFGIEAVSVETLLNDKEIDIVVNLTVPKAHSEINQKAIRAGKHVYTEKPFAVTLDGGVRTIELAQAHSVRVGSAPDTFLGGGLQTCRKLIDEGAIGYPVAATAFMAGHGMETWHPNPEFFYKTGGGPMLDMGPYYLTALVSLLGPIRRITGSTRISFPERLVTSQPNAGKRIVVETPTHIAGVMDFANGAVGTIITSFDIWKSSLPRIEIYGSEGTLSVPDPNTFGGSVRIARAGGDWEEIPPTHGYTQNSRGLGVADMADGILNQRDHRANGELALHVLESMLAFEKASRSGTYISLSSSCDRPLQMQEGLQPGQIR
jgi:predicted dehydrogenase